MGCGFTNQGYKGEIIGLLNFYLHFYENCHPFNSVEERAAYAPTTIRHIEELYSNVKVDGTMSIYGAQNETYIED